LQNIKLEVSAVIAEQLAQQLLTLGNLDVNQTIDLNSGLRVAEGVQVNPNQMRVRVLSAQP